MVKRSSRGNLGDRNSNSASPHKHTRECCRVALSSAAVPKPRGKAFKRARFKTLIHMTRKKRFAIVDHEAASSMQLCSTCSTRQLEEGHGTSMEWRSLGDRGETPSDWPSRKRRVYRFSTSCPAGLNSGQVRTSKSLPQFGAELLGEVFCSGQR
jgi:hypothetical protein